MKLAPLLSVSVLSLGLSLSASAKQFRIPLSTAGANTDGNYASLLIDKGNEGQVAYELIAATPAVESFLSSNQCRGSAIVEASVLSSTQEIDYEAHKMGVENVKLLVRQITCAGIVPTR